MTVAEKLVKVAENAKLVRNVVKADLVDVAGNVVAVGDVSSTEHLVGVKLTGDNFFPTPAVGSETKSGITVEYKEDGTIIFNGTATETQAFVIDFSPPLSAGSYTIRFNNPVSGHTGLMVQLSDGTTAMVTETWQLLTPNTTASFTTTTPKIACEFIILGNKTFNNFTIKPELTTDFSSVQVSRCGKNLFDHTKSPNTGGFTNVSPAHNVTILEVSDSGDNITIQGAAGGSGTAFSSGWVRLYDATATNKPFVPPVRKNTIITISADVTLIEQGKWDNQIFIVTVPDLGGSTPHALPLGKTIRIYRTVEVGADELTNIHFAMQNNTVKFENVMVSYSTDTDYEPYKAPTTYTANADGSVDGVTSLSPSMTLFSENKGFVINCKYFPIGTEKLQEDYNETTREIIKLRDNINNYL